MEKKYWIWRLCIGCDLPRCFAMHYKEYSPFKIPKDCQCKYIRAAENKMWIDAAKNGKREEASECFLSHCLRCALVCGGKICEKKNGNQYINKPIKPKPNSSIQKELGI